MADTLIIGDGPGGLSAALFLARREQDVVVVGQDKTAMHFAQLNNYLGISSVHGSEFQRVAREQVQAAGATLRDDRVTDIEASADGFTATLESGDQITAQTLVLSEGKGPRLAIALGLTADESGAISVDANSLSAIPNVYVVGRSTRPGRSQAIISAGDGAAAAIDILSRAAGRPISDWDSP